MKAPQRIYINPTNAILVIVDVQNEFCKPCGKQYFETSARVVPGVISAINGLAERSRSAGIPVIYIQSVRTTQEAGFTVFGGAPLLKIGTWAAEIVDELKPHEGDTVIQKFSHDPFYKTNLDQVLEKLVTDPTKCYAVVTGGGINVCLYHAVMGFHLRDYWTIVPVDCAYYGNISAYQIALRQFSHPAYPNVFLSRSDLIEVSPVPAAVFPRPVPMD